MHGNMKKKRKVAQRKQMQSQPKKVKKGRKQIEGNEEEIEDSCRAFFLTVCAGTAFRNLFPSKEKNYLYCISLTNKLFPVS